MMVLQTKVFSDEIQITENWHVVKIVGSRENLEAIDVGDVVEYVPSWSEYKLPELDRQMYAKGFRYKRILVMKNNQAVSLTNELVPVTLDTTTPIGAGKMRSDCGDIRFYWWNSDTSAWEEISYWIDQDTVNTSATKIILRIPGVSANGYVNVVAYYGAKHYGRKDDLTVAHNARKYEGKYLSFDGVDDYIAVSNIVTAKPFSVVVRVRSKSGVVESICDTRTALFESGGAGFAVEDNVGNGTFRFGVGDGTNYAWSDNLIDLSDKDWHWVAVTVSSTTATLYLDGASVGTVDVSAVADAFGGGTTLKILDGLAGKFTGDVSFVGFWNVELTADDVAGLMSGKVPAGALILLDDSDISSTAWADSSGNGNNATLYGNPVIYKLGKVLEFDGVDDYVSVVDSSSLGMTGAISVVVTFRPKSDIDSSLATSYWILGKSDANYADGGWLLGFEAGTGKLVFLKADGTAGTANATYGTNWDAVEGVSNNWKRDSVYLVASVWDGTTNADGMRIYVNGNLESTDTALQSSILNNTFPLKINQSLSLPFEIYSVFVYNRPLSDVEVQSIYENPENPPRAGMVLWLAPDSVDDVNGVWKDKSGLGNDGTIYGATLKEVRTFESTVQTSKVMSFDGVDDYVKIILEKSVSVDKFTAWFVFEDSDWNSSGEVYLAGKSSDSRAVLRIHSLGWTSGKLYNEYYSVVGSFVNIKFSDYGWQGKYNSLVLVYDIDRVTNKATIRAYLNGVLVNQFSDVDAPIGTDLAEMMIGSDFGGLFSNPKVVSVGIWGRILSDTEIQQVYNDPSNPPLDGLLLWLDDTSIDEVNGRWLNKAPAQNTGYVEMLDGIINGATPEHLLVSAWSDEIDINEGVNIVWRGKVVKKVAGTNSITLYVRLNNLGTLLGEVV